MVSHTTGKECLIIKPVLMLRTIHNAFLFVIKPSMQHRKIQPVEMIDSMLVNSNTK
ncbi:hypothetical protein Hanom_Chr06g00575211 [Helianthus anomalus]